MVTIDSIMLPTDFSDTSKVAQRYAKGLARQYSAELHVVHVILDPAYVASPMGMGSIPDSYHSDMEARSDEELETLFPDNNESDIVVVRKTLGGSAAYSIVEYAKDNKISMIVMGTHGYSGLSRLLLGSVAEKVVRTSPCPVLTVHSDDNQFVED